MLGVGKMGEGVNNSVTDGNQTCGDVTLWSRQVLN